MIYCGNCHAPMEEDNAKCPYCGALYVPGGEKHYMEQLYDIKKDVEELTAVPGEAYRREIGKTGQVIRRTFLAATVLLVFVGLLFFVNRKHINSEPTAEDMHAQMMWKKEVFPQLDALYAAGDYDGVMTCVFENQEESYYSIDNWKHADFINVYTWYQSCMEKLERAASEGYDEERVEACILDVLFLIQERTYDSYTEDEEALIAAYQREVREQTCAEFDISEEEIDRLYESCCVEDEYGVFFDYQTAKKKVKSFVKEHVKTN